MSKVVLFLEKMWLMVAIICGVMAIYKAIYVGLGDGIYFLFFGLMATLLWYLRRRIRIRMFTKQEEQSEE